MIELHNAPADRDPAIDDRNRQLVELRAASPLRPATGRADDVDGLALFDAARQPSLF